MSIEYAVQNPLPPTQCRTVAAELKERLEDPEKGASFLVNLKQKLKDFKAAAVEDMNKLETSRDELDVSTTAGGRSDRGRAKTKHDKSDSDDDDMASDSDESTWELDEAGEKQRVKLAKLAKKSEELGGKRGLVSRGPLGYDIHTNLSPGMQSSIDHR